MALSYNLGYQESISVHPTRRQNFAGKVYSNFPNIWEWLICSSAACFPGSGLNEEPGKMEEPGLNFCRARFAIVSSTCCNFFAFFLPPALNQHLIAACQCQNKSLVHFLLQEKAIFLKKRAKNQKMRKMKIFKGKFVNFFDAANQKN